MTAPDVRASTEPTRDHGVLTGLQFPDIPRLELDQLLEQLRDRADDVLATQGRLRGLLRANAAVASDLSLPALLDHVVDAARDLLRARYAAIVVLGSAAQLQQFIQVGVDEELLARINKPPHGVSVRDLLAEETDEISSDASITTSGRSATGRAPVGGFLGVPIKVGSQVFGNLYLRAPAGRTFSSEDEELVTALASTAGVAIANAHLLAESEQRQRWLAASSQLTNRLLAADADQPLTAVIQAALTASDADFATLTVLRDNADAVVVVESGVLPDALVEPTATPTGTSAGSVVRTGTAVLLSDDGGYSLAPPTGGMTPGAIMIFPLSAGGQTRGAITIGRHPGRAGFTNADLDMAASFGTNAAVALALAEAKDTQFEQAKLDDHDRIAFDMHDHVIGELFALGMGLQGLAAAIAHPSHVERLATYVETLDRVISTIRTTIFQLQPRRHDPAGLQTRILGIVDAHTDQLGYRPRLHFTGPIDVVVDAQLAADVLAVTREALSNCARHAYANEVTVDLVADQDVLTLEITDNGVGMGVPTRSSGLSNIRRRAENHGGTLTITAPDAGGSRLTWSAKYS